jgi:hypothetical protein
MTTAAIVANALGARPKTIEQVGHGARAARAGTVAAPDLLGRQAGP